MVRLDSDVALMHPEEPAKSSVLLQWQNHSAMKE